MNPANSPLVSLDTNVYISGTTISTSPPGQIIQAWEKSILQIALSEPILNEIKNVFSRPYFVNRLGWEKNEINQYINNLRLSAIVVPGTTTINICRDPKDNMIFSCALESKSDYIVSGDKDVLVIKHFNNIPVMKPREFVERVLYHLK